MSFGDHVCGVDAKMVMTYKAMILLRTYLIAAILSPTMSLSATFNDIQIKLSITAHHFLKNIFNFGVLHYFY